VFWYNRSILITFNTVIFANCLLLVDILELMNIESGMKVPSISSTMTRQLHRIR
jgi:hypothetical protein